jgi:hypothetical protein
MYSVNTKSKPEGCDTTSAVHPVPADAVPVPRLAVGPQANEAAAAGITLPEVTAFAAVLTPDWKFIVCTSSPEVEPLISSITRLKKAPVALSVKVTVIGPFVMFVRRNEWHPVKVPW